MNELLVLCMVVSGVALFIATLIGGVIVGSTAYSKQQDRIACRVFSEQSSRETRFVIYNYWKWDCLTPSGDGKWISTTALRQFGDTP